MARLLLLLLCAAAMSPLFSQMETIGFESELTEADTFLNGADGTTSFDISSISFPVAYDFDNNIWSGQWAISTVRDSVTPNFTNLYGNRQGSGADGSSTFAVGQSPFGGTPLHFTSSAPIQLTEVDITNTTYAYFTIRDGNQFSKAFGGTTGEDPDYFYIRWVGYLEGNRTDSLDIYLADYRFPDSEDDYILEDWTSYDLSQLGVIDSVTIEFYSSDTGQFGINTPLFFCMDEVSFEGSSSAELIQSESNVSIFPNPVRDEMSLRSDVPVHQLTIVNQNGQRVQELNSKEKQFSMDYLLPGLYYLVIETDQGRAVRKFIKL